MMDQPPLKAALANATSSAEAHRDAALSAAEQHAAEAAAAAERHAADRQAAAERHDAAVAATADRCTALHETHRDLQTHARVLAEEVQSYNSWWRFKWKVT